MRRSYLSITALERFYNIGVPSTNYYVLHLTSHNAKLTDGVQLHSLHITVEFTCAVITSRSRDSAHPNSFRKHYGHTTSINIVALHVSTGLRNRAIYGINAVVMWTMSQT